MRFVPPAEANLIQRLPPYHVVGNVIAWAMRALPQRILRPFLMKFLTTVLGPSPALFSEGAILINRQGERFVDELSAPASALARQTPNEAYIGVRPDIRSQIFPLAQLCVDRSWHRLCVH
jgi:fumarate reductase flavoprotein subunit